MLIFGAKIQFIAFYFIMRFFEILSISCIFGVKIQIMKIHETLFTLKMRLLGTFLARKFKLWKFTFYSKNETFWHIFKHCAFSNQEKNCVIRFHCLLSVLLLHLGCQFCSVMRLHSLQSLQFGLDHLPPNGNHVPNHLQIPRTYHGFEWPSKQQCDYK